MAMTFFLHDSIQPDGAFDMLDHGTAAHSSDEPSREGFPLLRGKLRIPATIGNIDRPRLTALLERSRDQFPSTLISGRAGTGKTALAASLASGVENACWYTVDATDGEWPVFSRYFSASLSNAGLTDPDAGSGAPERETTPRGIAQFLLRHFFRADAQPKARPLLIVLDDIHHIFDAPWFEEFFNLLIYSLPAKGHLLMLCRSKPPAPMWRLRSKQMLNVLDEKVIAFTAEETSALYAALGISGAGAEQAREDSFGRVSKLLERAANVSTSLPPSN